MREVLEQLRRETSIEMDTIVEFVSGSSHRQCYRASSKAGDFIVKVNVDDFLTAPYGGTENEFLVGRYAALAGLAPLPIWSNQHVIVEEYLCGAPLDWSDESLETCLGLAVSLAQVSLPADYCGARHFSLSADLLASLRIIEALKDREGPQANLATRARRSLRAVAGIWAENAPDLSQLPAALTHADLSPDNVITHDGQSRLVDFEMSGICGSDFVYGQLSVDVLIEDQLAGRTSRAFDTMWTMIAAVQPVVPRGIQVARTVERLGFNAAYALRQLERAGGLTFSDDYVVRKAKVAQWCVDELEDLAKEVL